MDMLVPRGHDSATWSLSHAALWYVLRVCDRRAGMEWKTILRLELQECNGYFRKILGVKTQISDVGKSSNLHKTLVNWFGCQLLFYFWVIFIV